MFVVLSRARVPYGMQLQDQDQAVVEEALLILDEACQDLEHLEALIHKRPPLMSLGNMGRVLMMRYKRCGACCAVAAEWLWGSRPGWMVLTAPCGECNRRIDS